MSSEVHQIYATHCTYGSSAIEQRRGENADKVLGYSVRATSLDQRDIVRVYRDVDRSLSYQLYDDTPIDEVTRLTASSSKAPRRLVIIPRVSKTSHRQLVGQICHRQKDTAGRPRSYFGHLLTTKRKEVEGEKNKTEPAWSLLDCLNLWYWDGWEQKDSDQIDPVLKTLDELPSPDPIRKIDDALLLSFLRDDERKIRKLPNHELLPERWLKMEVTDRRNIARVTMQKLLETIGGRNRRNSVLLVVEPEMAIVLCYLSARLLPACLRDDLSFSSHETARARIQTTLAASWFYDPGPDHATIPEFGHNVTVLNTLEPETFEKSPRGIDEKKRETREVAETQETSDEAHRKENKRKDEATREEAARAYVDFILEPLEKGGWEDVDELLGAFDHARPTNSEQLHQLVKANKLAEDLLKGEQPVKPGDWSESLIENFIARKVKDHFSRRANEPVDEGEMKELCEPHTRLYPILKFLCVKDTKEEQTTDEAAAKRKEVIEWIANHLAHDKNNFEYLLNGDQAKDCKIDAGFKARATLAYMKQHETLPDERCADLFTPFLGGRVKRRSEQDPILCQAIDLAQGDLSVLEHVWANLSGDDPRRVLFYMALLKSKSLASTSKGKQLIEKFLALPEEIQAEQVQKDLQQQQRIQNLAKKVLDQDLKAIDEHDRRLFKTAFWTDARERTEDHKKVLAKHQDLKKRADKLRPVSTETLLSYLENSGTRIAEIKRALEEKERQYQELIDDELAGMPDDRRQQIKEWTNKPEEKRTEEQSSIKELKDKYPEVFQKINSLLNELRHVNTDYESTIKEIQGDRIGKEVRRIQHLPPNAEQTIYLEDAELILVLDYFGKDITGLLDGWQKRCSSRCDVIVSQLHEKIPDGVEPAVIINNLTKPYLSEALSDHSKKCLKHWTYIKRSLRELNDEITQQHDSRKDSLFHKLTSRKPTYTDLWKPKLISIFKVFRDLTNDLIARETSRSRTQQNLPAGNQPLSLRPLDRYKHFSENYSTCLHSLIETDNIPGKGHYPRSIISDNLCMCLEKSPGWKKNLAGDGQDEDDSGQAIFSTSLTVKIGVLGFALLLGFVVYSFLPNPPSGPGDPVAKTGGNTETGNEDPPDNSGGGGGNDLPPDNGGGGNPPPGDGGGNDLPPDGGGGDDPPPDGGGGDAGGGDNSVPPTPNQKPTIIPPSQIPDMIQAGDQQGFAIQIKDAEDAIDDSKQLTIQLETNGIELRGLDLGDPPSMKGNLENLNQKLKSLKLEGIKEGPATLSVTVTDSGMEQFKRDFSFSITPRPSPPMQVARQEPNVEFARLMAYLLKDGKRDFSASFQLLKEGPRVTGICLPSSAWWKETIFDENSQENPLEDLDTVKKYKLNFEPLKKTGDDGKPQLDGRIRISVSHPSTTPKEIALATISPGNKFVPSTIWKLSRSTPLKSNNNLVNIFKRYVKEFDVEDLNKMRGPNGILNVVFIAKQDDTITYHFIGEERTGVYTPQDRRHNRLSYTSPAGFGDITLTEQQKSSLDGQLVLIGEFGEGEALKFGYHHEPGDLNKSPAITSKLFQMDPQTFIYYSLQVKDDSLKADVTVMKVWKKMNAEGKKILHDEGDTLAKIDLVEFLQTARREKSVSKEKLEALRKRIGFKKFNAIDGVVKFLNFTWEAKVPYQRWIDANIMEAPGPANGEIKAFGRAFKEVYEAEQQFNAKKLPLTTRICRVAKDPETGQIVYVPLMTLTTPLLR